MYIFSRTLVETIKFFLLSIACSAVFSMMIFQQDVSPFRFVCFVLNLVACMLFLLFLYKNWQKVWFRSFSRNEYRIPALLSYGIYAIVSTSFYIIASTPQIVPGLTENPELLDSIRSFYRYTFQHSRFLEPLLNSNYSFVSFILSQLAIISVLIYVPRSQQKK